jgi:ATP-dependent Clp protease adapter protein ClpS
VDELSSTTGIVALAAAGAAAVSLAFALVLGIKLRRLRAGQRAILGERGSDDLVAHGERLERRFGELNDYVRDAAERLEERMAASERRMDGVLAHRAVVRYDAYNEMSGQQSSSIALLDEHRSGVVVSSILHRDQARFYVKQVVEGASEYELSPEEQQAIDQAMQ